jgi:hypothetical protein
VDAPVTVSHNNDNSTVPLDPKKNASSPQG